MSELLTRITHFIEKHELIKPGDKIIVGLSGGPDSVFLLHVLKQLEINYKLELIAAHLDHEWRPESAQDALFCQNRAEQFNIPIVIARASQIQITKKTKSLEEKGRLLRRCFFESVLKHYQADKIALAHHADDQEETFFIRLLRGSTITGLAGMWPKNGFYIRPLLEIYKADILAYLSEREITFLVDYTNESELFLRNKIRKKVIPVLRDCDSRFDSNFFKTLSHIQDSERFFDQLTKQEYLKIKHVQDSHIGLRYMILRDLDIFLQKRMLIMWLCEVRVPFSLSDNFLNEILRFIENKKANYHSIHQNWILEKAQSILFIIKK